MDDNRLLSIYFLLGRSPKDWDFMQDDWEDEYQELTDLNWSEFLVLHDSGFWKLHDQAQSIFFSMFSAFPGFNEIQEVFEAISADSEDWNDFFELVFDARDFEDLWKTSWLTRDNMESSLNSFLQSDPEAPTKVIQFHDLLEEWFNSEHVNSFRVKLIDMLKPLKLAVKNINR